jgi:2-polyprenyl-3-methyl-5-hydroxy-6-metoxy-1,4-benzoquinol methylase
MDSKADIKEYWETRLPQRWYSNLKPFTFDWACDVGFKRYNVFYPSLLEDAEFKTHEKENVLEIGCGIGTDSIKFARYGALVTATDLTEQAVLKEPVQVAL